VDAEGITRRWIGEINGDELPDERLQQAREYGEAQRAEGMAEGMAKGEAKGKAEAILAVLETRRIPVDGATRARITACSDAATLARAVTAASVEEVIAPGPSIAVA
jgi:flagellar biosynthesis/type III secretory pathway protein FliH